MFHDYPKANTQFDSLGNINRIIDSTGKLVVEYVYNAFGKIIDIIGEMKDTIGVNNPMRYKGYYYDSETQMYYCKSRYYNPGFCRWISGDSEKYIDTETPLGLNLFIYCRNILNKIEQGVEKMEREANKTIDNIEEFINGVIDFFTF